MNLKNVLYILWIFKEIKNQNNKFIFDINICKGLNQYLNKNLMMCNSCPSNMIPTADYQSCTCNSSSSYENNLYKSISRNCTLCTNSRGPSYDKLKCINCSNCTCNNNQIKNDKLDNGSYQNSYTCINCTNKFYLYKNNCIPLIQGELTKVNNVLTCESGYSNINNRCVRSVASFPLETAKQINYQSYQGNNFDSQILNPNSALINLYYQGIASSCMEKNIINDCQMFANICTLWYFSLSSSVCSSFKKLVDSRPIVTNPIE